MFYCLYRSVNFLILSQCHSNKLSLLYITVNRIMNKKCLDSCFACNVSYKKLSQLLFFVIFLILMRIFNYSRKNFSRKVIVQLSFTIPRSCQPSHHAIHNPNIIIVKIFSSTPLLFFNISSGFFSYHSFLIISSVSSTSAASYHNNLIIIRH